MSDTRIYGKAVDINTDAVQDFFDKRASQINSPNPYSSVLLSDHNPNLINEQVEIENQFIWSKLGITNTSDVLDIGCGIGRWAEKIIPVSRNYYGIDFSKNMIEAALARCPSGHFEQMSFQDFIQSDCKDNFSHIIISGILSCICDDDVKQCLLGMQKFFNDNCTIFIWEPCGIEQRLTLRDCPSESLKTDYNAIYRTKDEYFNLFKVFTDNRFSITFCEYYSSLGGTVPYVDTDKIYYILERRSAV